MGLLKRRKQKVASPELGRKQPAEPRYMNNISLLGIFKGELIELFFLPSVDENPTNGDHEIPERELFQYLIKQNTQSSILREIDHESKIIKVETHRQRGKSIKNEPFHTFVIFKTESKKDGKFWWSLEKKTKDVVVLQRFRDKNEVKNKFKETEILAEKLEGKGCMRELLTFLWIHMIIDVKYQRHLSRCESFIPLIMRKITKIGYKYETDFTYSTLSAEEKNPELSDLMDFLLNVSNWHPLVVATYLGDAELLDRLKQDGKYNINDIYNNFTLLNLAILFDKTEIFQHLLGKMKADPTKCDEKGRNALHTAAKFNKERKIIELLLNKIPIDQCDATGTTALHHAIMASNTDIVKCLLDNGADPKRLDQIGRLPLHVAASYASDTKIIDLLLEKREIANINEGNKSGVTALHHAAMASNNKMASHLLTKGADINCRDKNGLTPLHVAAFFAKDMELINLFLDNKKVNLRHCDELGQNVIAYARKNTYGLRQEIIDRLKEIDDGVIKEYNLLKLATCEMQTPIWKSFIWDDLYFGTASTCQNLSALIIAPLMKKFYKWKLFYIPFADLKPGKASEISESVLVRYIANRRNIKQTNISKSEICNTTKLLGDLNLHLKITQVQICQSSNNSIANLIKVVHSFIIFQTTSEKDGEHWWSLDKNADHIVLQRSRSLDAVKNKFGSQERKNLKCNIQDLVGKCSIKDLLTILWIHQVMQEFNPADKSSNSQTFVTLVREAITVRDNKDQLAHQSDGTLDLISTLVSGICKWHPLYLPIYLGNAKMYDRISQMTHFNHFNNEISMLNLAIAFRNKTKMVRHILENYNADPTKRDASGRNSLEMAAICANNTEVLDLLLRHERVKMDGCNEHGQTALHFTAASSNVVAARHLIKMGVDPNRQDKLGRTPLHYAAFFAKDIAIVDVLLKNKQVDVNSLDNHGRNALCYAKFNKINDVGLKKKIVSRFKEEKGIKKTKSSISDPALELEIQQYSNPELDKFLTIGKMKIKNGGKHKKNLPDPLRTATQSCKSSKSAILSKLQIFKYLTLSIIFFVSVLATFGFTLKYGGKLPYIIKSEIVLIRQILIATLSSTFAIFGDQSEMIDEWLVGNFYDHIFIYFYITDTEWLTLECLLVLCVAVCFVAMMFQYFNGKSQQKMAIPLFFVPDANKKPKEKHEISEAVLFRFLLNEETLKELDETEIRKIQMQQGILKGIFDKESKITEFEIHQSSLGLAPDVIKAFHVFIVFKTTSEIEGGYWWSLEKNPECIVLQRSRDKRNVKNKLHGKQRKNVKLIKEGLKGKGAIKDLFAILLAQQMIPEKNHTQNLNRQSCVTFVGQQINEIGSKYQEIFFKYSQTPENEQKQMLGLLSIIIMGAVESLYPLFFTSEITNTLDKMDNNMGIIQCGLTLLKFAIKFLTAKLVRHLLQCGVSSLSIFADPTTGAVEAGTDWNKQGDRHIQEKSIGDLNNFKAQVGDNSVEMEDKINELSLPLAIVNSDVKKARSLFEKFGAGISTLTWGETGKNALHLASQYSKTTDLIDFILETGEFHINGVDNDGWTPLHYAIVGSNAAINARHLLEKGADPTRCENSGLTPFHLAALCVDNDFHELLESIKERKKSGETAQLFELFKNSGFYSPLRGGTNVLHDATELLDIILETGKIDINGRNLSNGGTALHFALGSHNVKTTRYLLKKGADPTIRANDGLTPFHIAAAFSRKPKILDFIMANNQLDIDHRNKSGMTALHMAIKESNTVTASYLLSKGADPNAADQHGYTPLHTAVYHAKNMEIVELLLNHKDVNVNSLDKSGHVALNYAIGNEHGLGKAIANLLRRKKGAAKAKGSRHEPKNIAKLVAGGIEEDFDMQTIRFLIENGQDISAMTWGENGANALHLAASHAKTPDLIDVILETGKFDINGVDNDGWTPLHYAMKRPNPVTIAVARRLIKMGANPGVADKNGVTPLHMAVINAESMVLIELLLNADTLDVNCVDHNGRTPLHYAIVGSNTATNARYLLKKGADPTRCANDGLTPFHIAAAFSRETDILELGLIMANNKQLDIDHRNKSGMTALHMAIKESNVIAARFLLSNGANPNASDQHGYTPLHVAAYYAKDMDIVKLLVNHKDVNVNSLDKSGHDALDYAIANEHGLGEEIDNLLRGKGAAKTKGSSHEPKNIAKLVAGGIEEDFDMQTIRFLIENKQDISAMTWGENGANALHLAAAHEKTIDLIDAILETGKFDINGVDYDGRTPLHYSIKRPKPITINARRLIKMGANPGVADKNGVTPLHMAARNENAESMDLIEILLNTEVDVNCVDKQGRTPLDFARSNQHGLGQRIVAQLRESGAYE